MYGALSNGTQVAIAIGHGRCDKPGALKPSVGGHVVYHQGLRALVAKECNTSECLLHDRKVFSSYVESRGFNCTPVDGS